MGLNRYATVYEYGSIFIISKMIVILQYLQTPKTNCLYQTMVSNLLHYQKPVSY